MRLCIPLLSTDMAEASSDNLPLAAHFGLAERFAVVDSVSGEILDECGVAGHCSGPCHCPLPNLAASQVDALAGQAMGFRLLQLSRRAGLPVLAVKARTLGELRSEMRHQSSAARPLSAAICLTNTRCQSASGKA